MAPVYQEPYQTIIRQCPTISLFSAFCQILDGHLAPEAKFHVALLFDLDTNTRATLPDLSHQRNTDSILWTLFTTLESVLLE